MSSSRSSTSQNVNQTDNRRTIGQGGVSAEGGSTVTINTLDANAINAAFAYGNDASNRSYAFGGRALDFASDTVAGAFGFGGQADSAAARSSAQAYNFAGDALGGALQFGSSALTKAFNSADGAAALVKDAYADAKGRGALTDKILIGAVLAMAVVAFAAVKK